MSDEHTSFSVSAVRSVHQLHVVNHTKELLLRRASDSDGQFGLVVLQHSFDWDESIHSSLRSVRRLREGHAGDNDELLSWTRHVRLSNRTHESHYKAWILPAVLSAERAPTLSSSRRALGTMKKLLSLGRLSSPRRK